MGNQKKDGKPELFRIMLVNDTTHETIRVFKATMPRLIYAAITAVIVIIALAWCIIALTPLRSTVPGYPDSYSKKVAMSNAMKIDSLESAVTRWSLYAENLSRVLSGETSFSYDSLTVSSSEKFLSSKSADELAKSDSILRETVRKEEQSGVSGDPARTLPIQGMHFFTPVKGVVTTSFDRADHPGIDISANEGSIVSAILDGTAIFTGWDSEAGYILILQHKDNVISVYQNTQKLLVKSGESVTAGAPVAIIGSSPSGSGKSHLHLELWQGGEAIDPQIYISF